MTDTVKMENLVPGDVLLYKGTGFVSRAIQFFDGTDFSHASIYLGNGMVGEAVATGLERRPYDKGAHGIWVQAHRLKEPAPTMDPVLAVANMYLDQGNRYGYEQLLLLALLCLTRKLRFTPSLRALIRRVLDAAAAVLSRMLSEHREPMICSEFAYRAYDEALPGSDDMYSLWINRLMASNVDSFSRDVGPGMVAPLPTTPAKGHGIHPQSLLALLNSRSASTWVRGPVPATTVAAPADLMLDAPQLDSLIETYLGEVKADPQTVLRDSAMVEPTLQELSDATNNFAMNLYAATHATGDMARSMDAPTALSIVSEFLTRTAADFVTPADLYGSEGLFVVGKIEG